MLYYLRALLTLTVAIVSITIAIIISPIGLINPYLLNRGWKTKDLPLYVYQNNWGKLLLWCMDVQLEVNGLENVPDGSSITACNHSSTLDLLIVTASPVPFKFVMKKEILWQMPFISWGAYLFGHTPIDRNNRDKAISVMKYQAKMAKLEKRTTTIFIEGTRSIDGKLQSFKKGAFHIAYQNNLPIVPGVIKGAHEIFPVGRIYPIRGGKVSITYLKPIYPNYDNENEVNRLHSLTYEVMSKFIYQD